MGIQPGAHFFSYDQPVMAFNSRPLFVNSIMTKTQAEILELFQKLALEERQEVVELLYEQVNHRDFYDRMSLAARQQLQQAIAQADQGQTLTPEVLRASIAKRFSPRA